jgi:hypothetical protein
MRKDIVRMRSKYILEQEEEEEEEMMMWRKIEVL